MWVSAAARFTALAVACFSCNFAAASFLSTQPVHFTYPTGTRSERDLPVCAEHAVCSVLHKRFWGVPPLIERLCRCAGRLECPATWIQGKDMLSMHLNSRAQLKFCKDISKLKKCRSGGHSLTVSSRHTPPDTLTQTQANVVTMAVASCYCPGPPAPRHWQHKDKDFTKKIPRCDGENSCGNVREDLFSSYYHCSCLRGSLCLFGGHEPPRNVSEVLFNDKKYLGE
ncbi:hypothetical protein B566_EDAN003925 [Ephemera danica]|nr:hypothetical protein B566_EDAN003925 [Ephemera danica]